MFITVQVSLMGDKFTPKKHQQLQRLMARDTTVIREYLQIIEQEATQLWQKGYEGRQISFSKLDQLTLTSKPITRQRKDGKLKTTKGRPRVKYDLKKQFHGRITVRELKECRDTAVAMWHSYCEQLLDHERIYWKIMQKNKYLNLESELAQVLNWWETQKKPSRPCQAPTYQQGRLPRRMNLGTTAFLRKRQTTITRYWLEVYYPEKGKHLWLPLNPSAYHVNLINGAAAKTVQLIKHENARWYAHVTLKYPDPEPQSHTKPLAVVSVDLGIKKAAVAVLLTADGSGELTARNIRFFESKEKNRAINELDNQIAALQRQKEHYRRLGKSNYGITRKLRILSRRRKQLAIQYDHELTAQLIRWVQRLAHRYRVYVAIGRLKGIRNSRRKGDGKSRKHRRELHRWSFARITEMLCYKLQRLGLSEDQVVAIHETWTSRTCCKCNSRNTERPFQALLLCHDCGAQLQADINAALNLAFKLIFSLRDEVGLDQWLIKPLLEGKYADKSVSSTGRKTSCTRESFSNSRPISGDELTPAVSVGEGTRNTTNRPLRCSEEG